MKLNNNDDSHNSGLNLLIYNMLLDIESHPAWVCGLKHFTVKDDSGSPVSHPAWVCGLKLNTLLQRHRRLQGHTLRGCIWIEALFTRWSSLWKNCKHSASCVFLFKLL